jgi:hypothetical protein
MEYHNGLAIITYRLIARQMVLQLTPVLEGADVVGCFYERNLHAITAAVGGYAAQNRGKRASCLYCWWFHITAGGFLCWCGRWGVCTRVLVILGLGLFPVVIALRASGCTDAVVVVVVPLAIDLFAM